MGGWPTRQALGQLAVRQGAHVRFAKTSRILPGGDADRTWEKRIHELVRPDILILDDFAMRQLSGAQADDLYELVSERQGRSLIITSNRAPSDWYPHFPQPRRRRVPPGPTHQHQPPGDREQARLPSGRAAQEHGRQGALESAVPASHADISGI
uniref:ATP-binding protein n=1 Tax=Streptomyces triticiradicis TaxID=2651189 RepID=UPI00298ECF42|nr:ATP-binding protein [Streptomyces triticiradicis]